MDLTQYAFIGGAVAVLTAAWGQIQAVWAKLESYVVTTVDAEQSLADAMLMYCVDTMHLTRLGKYRYIAVPMRVKTSRRMKVVAWEMFGKAGAVFWEGRKPIWLRWSLENTKTDAPPVVPILVTVSFFRWMFDTDTLFKAAVKHLDDYNERAGIPGDDRRHFIRKVTGRGKRTVYKDNDISLSVPTAVGRNSEWSVTAFRTARPIGYKKEEIGSSKSFIGLNSLSLSDEMNNAVTEAREWVNREDWYISRNIPWRMGWLLYGPPGTGKTTVTRAMSEELDLPVFVYDLASLGNDELQQKWTEMLSYVPCVALIEDIDAVFEGRTNKVGDLTFDCVLNCMDGIERADGLFIIITTNDISKVDSAIGLPQDAIGMLGGTTFAMSTRPGRISRAIEMSALDERGREKMARRILSDWPELWHGVSSEGLGETGDQFQDRCVRIATAAMRDKLNGHNQRA